VTLRYPVPLTFFCLQTDCVSPGLGGQCGASVLTVGTTFRSNSDPDGLSVMVSIMINKHVYKPSVKDIMVEHEPRDTKIPDRVFSVCVWRVNMSDLETRFEEEKEWMCRVMGNLGKDSDLIPLTFSCEGRLSKLWTQAKSCLTNRMRTRRT
jgi:hypothetical protein